MTDTIITSTIEKQYIKNLLDSNRRLDGRAIDEYREIKIEYDVVEKAEGSAIVHLGDTKVIAGVKILLGKPYSDYPNKGTLIVTAELNPVASPEFRNGPPQPDTIELARVTDRLIRESECIDLEDLCIIENKHVWTVFIDIYPLDDDGNLIDACALAAYAALKSAKVPQITVDEEENVEIIEDSYRPIKINNIPIAITTSKIGKHMLLDSNYKETAAQDARITFGFTEDYIVSGQKGGKGTFSSQEIIDIVERSMEKAKELRKIFEN